MPTHPQEQYILRGQRMAWEKAHEIRTMMLLEAGWQDLGFRVRVGSLGGVKGFDFVLGRHVARNPADSWGAIPELPGD